MSRFQSVAVILFSAASLRVFPPAHYLSRVPDQFRTQLHPLTLNLIFHAYLGGTRDAVYDSAAVGDVAAWALTHSHDYFGRPTLRLPPRSQAVCYFVSIRCAGECISYHEDPLSGICTEAVADAISKLVDADIKEYKKGTCHSFHCCALV